MASCGARCNALQGGKQVEAAPDAPDKRRMMPGNQAMLRLQAKSAGVAIGPRDDPSEHEADRVAESVMSPRVQRACAECRGEEDDESKVRRKAEGDAPPGGGAPMSPSTRGFFESRFDRDFSAVRVHRGPESHSLNDSLQSQAFAFGQHVWLGSGQTEGPNALLAHELAHVVQQTGKRPRIAQKPKAPPAPNPQAIREEFVREAIDFIGSLQRAVASDRMRARAAAATAGGPAAASRAAHPILNQVAIRQRLERGRGIYEAQRTVLDANHPLNGRLRNAYALFLGEVREAFDEAITLAANDQAAQRTEHMRCRGTTCVQVGSRRNTTLRGRKSCPPAGGLFLRQGDSKANPRDAVRRRTGEPPPARLLLPGGLSRNAQRDVVDIQRAAQLRRHLDRLAKVDRGSPRPNERRKPSG